MLLLSAEGRLLHTRMETIPFGSSQIVLDTSDISEGIYFLLVSSAKGRNTAFKIVKM